MGALDRLMLRDEQWQRMSHHIIGDERTRGSSGRDDRMFVEAVLWIVRTSSPWRDLPDVFGPLEQRLSPVQPAERERHLHRLFAAMADDGDFEYLIVDGTIIRAHQHASGTIRGLKIRPLAVPAAA